MEQLSHFSRRIGDYQVTAVSDGTMAASLDLLSGISPAEAENIQRDAGVTQPGAIAIGCYLIRGRGRTLLVDAGTGGGNGAGGLLVDNLRAAGVSPDEVDSVLLTHGHPDHIGGLLDADGHPVYRNAELHLHPLEAEHWLDDSRMQVANERGQRGFLLARRVLNAWAPRLRWLGEAELFPGIRAEWLPGHTPGHSGFRIEAGGDSLLIWGDIVHYPHIQSGHPAVSILFDYDAAQAAATRSRVLRQAASENLLVAGMHLGMPGFARVHAAGEGYRLTYAG